MSCTIKFPLISLDFAIDFAIFTMWLQTCGWTDGQTDGQNNGQTDRMMGRQTNEWMDMQYTCLGMHKMMIFQKHYGRTDGPTEQQTDGHTLL